MTLDELGRQFGTDKSSEAHNYLVEYEELLAPFRSKTSLGLLEIGVREGPSLRVWREYFPTAQITGVDIAEACRAHASERVAIEIGDQSDPHFLKSLVAKYQLDIIVDDGSHQWGHQIDSFRLLFPHLQPGGLYICEDLHTSRSKWVEKYGKHYTIAAAAYFGGLAAEVSAEGHVYGTMQDAGLHLIQRSVKWVRFGRGFVAIKKAG